MKTMSDANSQTHVVEVIGDFDASCRAGFQNALRSSRGPGGIDVDLSMCGHVGSPFVNAIVAFRNRFPTDAARMRLLNPSEFAAEVLRITKLDSMFPVVYLEKDL
jgi:anti-anti-sigma regulatory factor